MRTMYPPLSSSGWCYRGGGRSITFYLKAECCHLRYFHRAGTRLIHSFSLVSFILRRQSLLFELKEQEADTVPPCDWSTPIILLLKKSQEPRQLGYEHDAPPFAVFLPVLRTSSLMPLVAFSSSTGSPTVLFAFIPITVTVRSCCFN